MSATELYRATKRAPIAGTWRQEGETFPLTAREAEAEAIWGTIEKVVLRQAAAKKGKAKHG